MSQTVIGFFDNHSEAQRAIEQLQSSGISRERIDISTGGAGKDEAGNRASGSGDVNPVSGSERDENSVQRASDGRTVDREGRNTNMFTDFFNNLFGSNDNDDAGRYSHVAERAGAIITIHAQSREEAERVADILDDCGAVDVDERASQYGYTNTRSTGEMGGRSDILDSLSGNERNRESSGMRSRIFDKRIDDTTRLGGFGLNDDSDYNRSDNRSL